MSSHRHRAFASRLAAAFAVLVFCVSLARMGQADPENASVHEPRGSSWVAVSAFADHRALGNREVGAMATVGLALDRAGPALTPASTHAPPLKIEGDPASLGPPIVARGGDVDAATTRALTHLPITRGVARGIVIAAWRASGVGADDERLDGMITRARVSAILPETRLRAMRRIDDQLDDAPPTSRYYNPDSVDTWLEARFTWRLDRLLFVDEEPSVERLRIDRSEARIRIATRVLAVVSDWQRAWIDLHTMPADAPASLDGALRMADAEATLDVMTAGWFSRWRARAPPND